VRHCKETGLFANSLEKLAKNNQNTLAYFSAETVIKKNSVITFTPKLKIVKLFLFKTDAMAK
jgi:hypothetical protein